MAVVDPIAASAVWLEHLHPVQHAPQLRVDVAANVDVSAMTIAVQDAGKLTKDHDQSGLPQTPADAPAESCRQSLVEGQGRLPRSDKRAELMNPVEQRPATPEVAGFRCSLGRAGQS